LYHTLECHQNPASSRHVSLDAEAMSVPACPQIKNQYVKEQNLFFNKNISKKLKLRLKNTKIDKTLTYDSETGTLTRRDRKQLNIFERKVYRTILGPVYDNEKENWRILTNKRNWCTC